MLLALIILRSVSLYIKLKYYYINIYIRVTCTTCSSDFSVNKLSELLEDLIFIDRSAGEIGTCLIPGPFVWRNWEDATECHKILISRSWIKLPPALRQLSDSSYELTKTAPLAIFPQLFHSKQILSIFTLFSYLPPVSTLNIIHHSRLTVCLTVSGSDPLPIDFISDNRLWLSWFLRLRFSGRCRNLEFTITNHMSYIKSEICPVLWIIKNVWHYCYS